jgi:serine/threonine-protein kinase
MGVVYQARELRLNRVVALKMILAAEYAGAEAGARFLAEAESVARLHHPNVVQVFAFGDCDGRPYFAMEYVDGGSLADRLDGTPRPPREAARLVETLARAIHEAHRLGVVHRDLKPANILLTSQGVAKIADFGLAKSLSAEGGLTRSRWIVGSPSYMAPEQAEGRAGAAGPAADVYSLGAMLYELITGRPPFQAATVLETLERVRLDEPAPPARLRPGLPRDLVTVCLKCLEKDPARRYPSAAELAEDLRRFLGGEAVRARPVGRAERLWRWCRREPAVASLAIALLAGLVGVASQWRRAEAHARRLSEANRALRSANGRELDARRRAERRFGAAMRSLRQFERIAKDAALLQDPRLKGLRAELLGTAQGFYKELQASLEGDDSPAARSQLADAYGRVGRIASELGLPDEALAAHRRALALLERAAAAGPAAPGTRALLGRAHAQVGFTLRTMGRPAEAFRSYDRARELQEPLARDRPADARSQEALSWTLSNLGVIEVELGRPARAVALHRRAAAVHGLLVRRDPASAPLRSDLAWCWRYQSLAAAAAGEPAEAERQMGRAVAALEAIERAGTGDVESRWRLARCLDDTGRILGLRGRPGEAAEALHRAAALHEDLALQDPVQYGIDLARNQIYQASLLALSGRGGEAGSCLRRADDVLRRSSGARAGAALFDIACAYCLWSVAGQDGSVQPAEREARARRAVDALRRAAAAGHCDARRLDRDPAVDPLRGRRDFQELLLDLSFPTDPFGRGGTLAAPSDPEGIQAPRAGTGLPRAQTPSSP